MGFNTIAIGRGKKDEEELVKKLGARVYINNRSQDAVQELIKLGGAKVILATVPSGKAMSSVLGGLAIRIDKEMQSTKNKIESRPVSTHLATKTDLSQQ